MPIRRTIKNVVKNYSDAQVKVREATSNDPWGPSSTLMSEIADLSYNVLAFTEIMQMIWKRLNDHGKNWRHVYKALVVLDYIIKTGTEKVAQQCRENIFAIQTLKDFQFIDEGKDHGMNVREKAKQLVTLLKDEERLKNERTKALKAKERFAQSAVGIGSTGGMKYSTSMGSSTIQSAASETTPDLPTSESLSNVNQELEAARPSTQGEEELQLELALAMSKEEADEDEKRRKQDDIKLQMAVEQSKTSTEPESTQPQPDTLLDMALGNAAQQRQQPADTWGPPTLPPPSTDPWDPSPAPQPPPADPWSASQPPPPSMPQPPTDQWSAASTPAKPDPWAPSQPSQPSQQSPWEPSTANGAVSSGIDDEFDMITNRSPARSSLPVTNAMGGSHNDLLSGGDVNSGNPWDMEGLQDSLVDQRAKNKSPADFLGANANLVNLDNLVSRPPKPANDNPFAMTTPPAPNPFGVQQQNNAARVPLNQMVNTSSIGFAQPVPSGTMLQQPLVPTGGGAIGQSQPNNPFM